MKTFIQEKSYQHDKGVNTLDKQAYIEKIDATISQWKARADELKAKAREVEADQKIKYEKQARDIKLKIDAIKIKKEELRSSGEKTWHNLKEGIDHAIDEIKKAI